PDDYRKFSRPLLRTKLGKAAATTDVGQAATLSLGDGALSSLGEWLQLLLLRARRRALSNLDAQRRLSDELLRVLFADSDHLLSALGVRGFAGQERRLPERGSLGRQRDSGWDRRAMHSPRVPVLIGRAKPLAV